MITNFHHWPHLLRNKHYLQSFLFGLILMTIALFINLFLSQLVETFKTLSVGDIILDHIPTYDLNFIYTTGAYLTITAIIIYPLIFKPEIAPFTLRTYAFFVIIRAIFISLTQIGPHENILKLAGSGDNSLFFYKNDLFFSAHTGIPFLAFLIFYDENKPVSYLFLASSIVMGITVLLMHVHYSIDVFGAYFITYSIYKVSEKVFNQLNKKFKKIIKKLSVKIPFKKN